MSAITRLEMANGATVADWLGTAAIGGRMASNHMEAVREGRVQDEGHTLAMAHYELQRALTELGTVMQALEDAGLAAMA